VAGGTLLLEADDAINDVIAVDNSGAGAKKSAYRYDNIDFSQAMSSPMNTVSLNNINGGTITAGTQASNFANHTIGLSWHLNPFTKMVFNYVSSTETTALTTPPHTSPNLLNVYEMRAQIDF
jgi:phosphate-selective porin